MTPRFYDNALPGGPYVVLVDQVVSYQSRLGHALWNVFMHLDGTDRALNAFFSPVPQARWLWRELATSWETVPDELTNRRFIILVGNETYNGQERNSVRSWLAEVV